MTEPSLLDYLKGEVPDAGKDPEEVRKVEPKSETYPCEGCGKFLFAKPTTCYWCKNGR